jgi:hypothetical protein
VSARSLSAVGGTRRESGVALSADLLQKEEKIEGRQRWSFLPVCVAPVISRRIALLFISTLAPSSIARDPTPMSNASDPSLLLRKKAYMYLVALNEDKSRRGQLAFVYDSQRSRRPRRHTLVLDARSLRVGSMIPPLSRRTR